jgi:diguanylate cyclase (GGDEF)-like protein
MSLISSVFILYGNRSFHGVEDHLYIKYMTLLVLFFIFSFATPALASNEIVIDDTTSKLSLGKHLQYYEDKNGNLTIKQILSGNFDNQFISSTMSAPSFGFTKSTYWFHFRIKNKNNINNNWYLQLPYPLLDQIDVYHKDRQGNIRATRQGDLLNFKQRDVNHRTFLFNVTLPEGTSKDIYVRIKTQSSMQAEMIFWESNTFYQENQNTHYLFGIYYGVILSMLIYNLLVFFSIREKIYLYYVSHVLTFSLFQACLNGLTFQFLWPEHPWWGQRASVFFLSLACFNAILFTRNLLELNIELPRWDAFFKKFMSFLVVVMICTFFFSYNVMGQIGTATALLCSIMLNVVGWVSLKNKNKLAIFYVSAWTLFLLGASVFCLKTYALLPQIFITEYAIQIGSMFDIVLLSLVLSYRFKLLQQKNIQIEHQANLELEDKVRERTSKLNEKTKKLNETLDALTISYAKVEELNYTDGLTGIKNRKYFDEFYEHEWNNSLRSNTSIAMLMIDIDYFKTINDSYGHQAGDKILIAVSKIIKKNLPRKNDTITRYGGDEFMILLPQTDKEGALLTAKRIMDEINELNISHDGETISAHVSIGVSALIPTQDIEAKLLINQADKALYEAKANGRKCICSFRESHKIALNGNDN